MSGNIPASGVNSTLKKVMDTKVSTPSNSPTPIRAASNKVSIHKGFKAIANQRVKQAVKPEPERTPMKGDTEREPKLIETAKKRFQLSVDAETEIRKLALDDLKFFAGEQWPLNIENQRRTDGRPCLTINMMPQFTRQVTNEQRQNRPSVQINPVDDEGDPKTAEILQGIHRHIEYDSGADAAYDTAFQYAAISSFGYWRINTEYSSPTSFEQDIKIVRIRNPFTVYMDPNCKEADYSDAAFAFVVEMLSADEFKAQFPDAKMTGMDDWVGIGAGGWSDKDTCRVAEYFYKDYKEKTLVLLSDGSSMLEEYVPEELPTGVTVVKRRPTKVEVVNWVKINGVEVLEETEWAGRWIPIVPVLGEELDVDGRRVLQGIVRNAKDPQRQYNFMASATTETVALAPKAPFVGAEGQFEGHEQEWQSANTKNQAYLQYKNVSINGTALPPPQRQTLEPAIQATTMAMMQAAQDLKNTTGIQEAELGAPGNERSGKAILARQQQSQGSNFHFSDNLSRSIRHSGRIINDLIPKIYDTERVMRIIGEDGRQSTVRIGKPDPEQQEDVAEVDRIYDLSVGKYDVTISSGPSYQTKRQDAVNSQLELLKTIPSLAPLILDIVVGNMDFPEAQKMAKRLRTALPPQVAQADSETADAKIPPEVQQQLAQLLNQKQNLTQLLQATTDDLEKGLTQKQQELESKERIEFARIDVDRQRLTYDYAKLQNALVVADITAKAASAQAAMEHQQGVLAQLSDQSHEYAMQEQAAEHSEDAASAQVQQAQQSAQSPQPQQAAQ